MMFKKIMSMVAAMMLSLTMVLPSAVLAENNFSLSSAQKLEAIEQTLYGSSQAGSLLQRMDSVEKEVYGYATEDPILDRIGRMYQYLTGIFSSGEAGFTTKLNVVEWRMKESMSGDPARTRIEDLETLLNGSPIEGALAARLDNLLKLTAYADGVVPVRTVTLPKFNPLKIVFTKEFGTRDNKVGDNVYFKAMDNMYVDDALVIPKGATGMGKIKKIRRPSSFGRDAKIDIEFLYIYGVDGTKVPICVGDLSKQQLKSVAGSVGTSVGGMIVFGPVGAIGGAFVKGKQVIIPVGSGTEVQTSADKEIQGVVYQE